MDQLDDWRNSIDLLDDILLETIAKRMEISRRIGVYKAKRNIPVLQPERYRDMMAVRTKRAGELHLDHDFVDRLFALIHEESQHEQTIRR